MSYQAGIASFDPAGLTPGDRFLVTRWVEAGGSRRIVSPSHDWVALAASSSSHDDEAAACLAHLDATFDGRIDNRPDLLLCFRDRISGPKTNAALMIAAYRERDIAGFGVLVGDWSGVICDRSERSILLASDFAGVRPLYYCVRGMRAAWSSRLQPLVDWLGAPAFDETYIAAFLTIGGCPNRTPYRGIYAVPPGHCVKVSQAGAAIHRFWSLPVDDCIQYARESDYEDHLRHLFREAVRVRMPHGGPWFCELSGGLDSSSVTLMAADLVQSGDMPSAPPGALSYEHQGSLDERFYCEVAERCGLEHTRIPTSHYPFLTEEEVGGPEPAFWQPLQDHTARTVQRRGCKALLTGGLGDIVMGNWHDDIGQVAAMLRKGRGLSAIKQSLAWSKQLHAPITRVLARAVALASPRQLWHPNWWDLQDLSAGNGERPADLLQSAFRQRSGVVDPQQLFSSHWMNAHPEHRLHHRALAQMLELRTLQVPAAFGDLDYTHPFVHRPLAAFMLSIPANILCRPGEPRRLMRRAFRPLWPAALRKRRSKDTFDSVFLESLRPLARRVFEPGRTPLVCEYGYVDRQRLFRQLNRLDVGFVADDVQIRQILLLEYWLRKWHRDKASPLPLSA